MGIFDRFLRSRSAAAGADTTPPPRRPKGGSGRTHLAGTIQPEEQNHDLIGVQGLRTYDRMFRTDADCRKAIMLIANPIIAGTWTMEPYGGDKAEDADAEIAKTIEWALQESMRPGLKAHLAEALPLFLRSGFTPFEHIWRPTEHEGKSLLLPWKIDVRLPRSVDRWHQDGDGELVSIEQYLIQNGRTTIPRNALLYYRLGAEGDNWEGTPLLRPAYKHWLIKDGLERVDAVAQERSRLGMPVFYSPRGGVANEEQMRDVELAIDGMRSGDTGYLLLPWHKDTGDGTGAFFEIVGQPPTGTSGIETTLKYHREAIMAAVIADFMELGKGGEGARATGETKLDPFHAGVEAIAGIIEDEWNRNIIPRLVALNFPDAGGTPKLKMSKADSTSLAELATATAGLITSGVLHPDDELEDYFRERFDFPAADEEAREERKKLEEEDRELAVKGQEKALEAPAAPPGPAGTPKPGQPKPSKPGAPKKDAKAKTASTANSSDLEESENVAPAGEPATFARQDRELREWEAFADLDTIEAAISGARDRFREEAGPAMREYAHDVARRVAAGEDVEPEAPAELQNAIASVLRDLFDVGRATVVTELNAQRTTPLPEGFAQETVLERLIRFLTKRARIAARAAATRIVTEAERAGLATEDLARIQAAAEQAGEGELRAQALVHAAPALNVGRSFEADQRADEIRGARYTSILDGNRCDPCRHADDDVLRPLNDPLRLARKPPNRECHGGDRCRCMEVFELLQEAPPSS